MVSVIAMVIAFFVIRANSDIIYPSHSKSVTILRYDGT